MIGAIAGDIIGSAYEFGTLKTTEFPLFGPRCRFTDDTVLTVALADAILHDEDYVSLMKQYYSRFPDVGYGGTFIKWVASTDTQPYNSFGNGAAMRISPVGFYYDTLEEVLAKAEQYTAVTHNHPEGIKGAQATAASIFLARNGTSKDDIRQYITDTFGYDLSRTCDQIRPNYSFDVTCQGTVPEAIICFLESSDYESAVRLVVSLGGDSDTMACITGGIAEAFYGVPSSIKRNVELTMRWDGTPMYYLAERFMEFCRFKRSGMQLYEVMDMWAFLEDDRFDYPIIIYSKDYRIDKEFRENLAIGLRLVFQDVSVDKRQQMYETIMVSVLVINELSEFPDESDRTQIDDEELNEFLELVETSLLQILAPEMENRIKAFCERKNVPEYPYVVESPSDWDKYQ